jgi:predicted HicB family RNase H-like nuclease
MRKQSAIPMNLRIKPTLKAKLERLAEHDRRTLHAYVKKLLNDHVKGSPTGLQHQGEAKRRSAV